jgi:hypothetical protein
VTNFKRIAMAEKLTDIDRRSLQAYCHALLCSAEFRILN